MHNTKVSSPSPNVAMWARTLLTTLLLSLLTGGLLGFVAVRTNIILEIFIIGAGILLGLACAIAWPKEISGRAAFALFVVFGWILLWTANIMLRTGGSLALVTPPLLLKAMPLTFLDFIFEVYAVFAACWAWDFWLRRKGLRQPYQLTESERRQYDILLMQILTIGIIGLASIITRTFPSIGLLSLLLIGMFGFYPRHRAFLLDFAPILFMLLSYDSLRLFADDLTPNELHITDLIAWERTLLGGHIANVVLQNWLWDRSFSPLLDNIALAFYYSHYILPIILMVIVWQLYPRFYWPLVGGIVVLAYMAFITYILFPAAPPWWAAHFGYLEGVRAFHSIDILLNSPNPVAAMPSLHMAMPTYLALFGTMLWRKRGLWLWIFPLGVAFATIYLGHHYVVDLLAGMVYAFFVFAGVYLWIHRHRHLTT
ncbi:phosphatase PAP2 family protein [Ardenticatena maritima]|uniref:phosphatase PAP2 family protein n=1 Tax=Ardenticatena maritima TaxID=872965 RepID=UPI00136497A9|nr:phosphatase PAP2 family protein [Ardenticatena maritima]